MILACGYLFSRCQNLPDHRPSLGGGKAGVPGIAWNDSARQMALRWALWGTRAELHPVCKSHVGRMLCPTKPIGRHYAQIESVVLVFVVTKSTNGAIKKEGLQVPDFMETILANLTELKSWQWCSAGHIAPM